MMLKVILITLVLAVVQRVGGIWKCDRSATTVRTPATTTTTEERTTTADPCAYKYPKTKTCTCMWVRGRDKASEDDEYCHPAFFDLRLAQLAKPQLVNNVWTLVPTRYMHEPKGLVKPNNSYQVGLYPTKLTLPAGLEASQLKGFDDYVANNKTRFFIEETQAVLCDRSQNPFYKQLGFNWEIFNEDFSQRWINMNITTTLDRTVFFQFQAVCRDLTLKLPFVLNVTLDQDYFDNFSLGEGNCYLRFFNNNPEKSDAWATFNQADIQKKCVPGG